jgi:hypothetical protein
MSCRTLCACRKDFYVSAGLDLELGTDEDSRATAGGLECGHLLPTSAPKETRSVGAGARRRQLAASGAARTVQPLLRHTLTEQVSADWREAGVTVKRRPPCSRVRKPDSQGNRSTRGDPEQRP